MSGGIPKSVMEEFPNVRNELDASFEQHGQQHMGIVPT